MQALVLTILLATFLVGCGDPYDKGLKAYEAGRWKEAITHFQRVSTWSEHRQEIKELIQMSYFRIGQRAFEEKNWQEALDYLRKIKDKHPHFAEARDLIGCTFYKLGEAAYEKRQLAEAKRLLNVVRTGCSHYDKTSDLMQQINLELKDSAAVQ